MSELFEKASERAAKAASDIADDIRAESMGNSNYVLAYMAVLFSGLLGTASAALGKEAAFQLLELTRHNGEVAMQFIHAESQVKH